MSVTQDGHPRVGFAFRTFEGAASAGSATLTPPRRCIHLITPPAEEKTMSTVEKRVKSPWDYAAYAAIPEDGKRHEIIEGEHFVNPAPTLYHQEVSRHIQFQLYTQIELTEQGKVINAPVDLQLSDHDIVQPDLVIVTRARKHIMTPIKIKGVPDLVVEILSPSNPRHDLETKRKLYENSGIPEYWIVSPNDHQITQLVLQDDRYTESIETTSITMKVAPQATVDLTRVW